MTNKERQASLMKKAGEENKTSGKKLYCNYCVYQSLLGTFCRAAFFRCKKDFFLENYPCAKAYNRMTRNIGGK